jgi:VWFA-related protein
MLRTAVLLTGLPLLAGFATSAAPQEAEPFRVAVNVDLVLLQATVRDQKGRPVSGLRGQDFEVYEDGVRQSIRVFLHEDVPVTVGLVVDHSGSMRPKLAHVVAAARTFVESSSPQDEMFVVNFNETVTMGLREPIRFTNRPDELARAIDTPVTGKTALYDALTAAHDRLRMGTRDKKVLVVISDGADNASTHTLAEVVNAVERSSVLVYTIGIFADGDPDRNPGVLRRLAAASGGEAFFPAEFSDVVPVCEAIARDIRSQYTLGYVSSNQEKVGPWRAVRVAARGTGTGKLMVRTRTGYFREPAK